MRWGLVSCLLFTCAGFMKAEEEATVEEIKVKSTKFCKKLELLLCTQDEEVVEVSLEGLGKLKGKTGEARNNAIFYQFLGVPFAAPPLGANR